MADYRVRFQGDLGNLASFSSSIRGAFSQIKSGYQASATSPISSLKSPNLSTGNVTTQIDAYNRTLTQSGQVFHRYVSGWVADLAKLEVAERRLGTGGVGVAARNPSGFSSVGTSVQGGQAGVYKKDIKPVFSDFFTGKYKTTVSDLDKVEAAQLGLARAEREFSNIEKTFVTAEAKTNAARQNAIARQIELMQIRNKLEKDYIARTTIAGGTAAHLQAGSGDAAKLRALNPTVFTDKATTEAYLNGNKVTPVPVVQAGLQQIRGLNPLSAAIAANAAEHNALENAIIKADADLAKAITKRDNKIKALRIKYAAQFGAFDAALNSTPPIPRDLDRFLNDSKGFRNKFTQRFGIQTPYVAAPTSKTSPGRASQINTQREAFSQELLARGINPESIKVAYDFERQMHTITGQATSASGAVGTWTATIDKNNKYVERWGSNLRTSGGFIKQTSRDLQKVIEWTVATTVVFGALGVAIGSIGKINEVNKDLQRYSITAKTSAEETQNAFKGVAQIAYDTATPLQDLTAVMDDIALATRRASQTSAEWTQAQLELTRAVGIFTNLTGVDTVRATDLLSAAYKQLSIQPDKIADVLNKVTAVGGGNAQAIEDIVQALGSVSEAAKAAGLSIDEQIASVQALSQVTNKSASEVAVSFKNLFGSISSKGSEAVLGKFNIQVRNATGELRPFLEIYKDIADAKDAGRISEGQLQDVLRGISGGPRRAPDAAALLENIDLIFEQIDKSVGATNEALIANARVLDTNAAKIQQLRTAFDTALVEQFTSSINKLISVVITLGQGLQSIFGSSGVSSIASGATQLGLILVAVLALTKGFSLLGKGVGGLRNEFNGLIKAEKSAGGLFGSLNQFSNPKIYRQTPLPGGGRPVITQPNTFAIPPGAGPLRTGFEFSKFGGAKILSTTAGRVGLAAGAVGLVGLGAAAAGATNAGSPLPTVLQGIGAGLTILGGPIGIAAGVTLAGVGIALGHLSEEADKAVEKSKSLRSSVYDNIQALGEERKAYNNAESDQKAAGRTIEKLSKQKSLDADETNRLEEAQKSYVDATFAMNDANNQIIETNAKLLEQIPQLGEKFKSFADAAKNGLLSFGQLKELSSDLAADILKISGAAITPQVTAIGTRPSQVSVYRDIYGTSGSKNTIITGTNNENRGRYSGGTAPLDADALAEAIKQGGFDYVTKLLDESKRGFFDDLPDKYNVNSNVVDALGAVIAAVPQDQRNTEEFTAAVTAFGQFVNLVGTQQQILSQSISSISAVTTAKSQLGILSGPQAQAAQARSAFADLIKANLPEFLARQTTAQSNRPLSENASPSTPFGLQQIQEFLLGKNGQGGFQGDLKGKENTSIIDFEEAKKAFAILQQIVPVFASLNKEAADQAAIKLFETLGYTLEGIPAKIQPITDDVQELKDAISESVTSGKQGLFNDLLQLRAQFAGGEFKDHEGVFRKQTDQIKALIKTYNQLGSAFENNTDDLDPLKKSLGQLHYLRGIELTDNKELLPTLINYAQTMGLTGGQVDNFAKRILRLIDILNAMDKIKAEAHINVSVNLKQMIDALRVMNKALKALPGSNYTGGPTGVSIAAKQASGLAGIIARLEAEQAKADRLTKAINSGFGNAKGTGFPGSTKDGGSKNKPPAAQVSLLDIPDEFHESQRTVASLLKESVKNARELQHKIPGEDKKNKRDIVAILDGTKKVLQTRGVGEDYLRRAMDELAEQIKRQNDLLAKANDIRRIRVGGGDFAAIANLPVNTTSGISLAGNNNVNITLNLNGTVLSPAQFSQFADQIAAALKKQLAS